MAEGRSCGAAAEGRKGPRKRCIFPKSDALLDIGVLTREKEGEKRCESSASIGMHHFHEKLGDIEAPRELVFGLTLAAKSARKRGCSRLVDCRRCTGFFCVLYRHTELSGKGMAMPGCLPKYKKFIQLCVCITNLGWDQSGGNLRQLSERKWSNGRSQWSAVSGGGAGGVRAAARPGPAGRKRGTDSGLAAFRCIGKFPTKPGSIRAGYFRASKPKVRYDGTTAATVRIGPPRSSLERRNENSSLLEFKMGRTANSHPTLRREHLSSGVISWERSMSILQGGALAGIGILMPSAELGACRNPGLHPTPSPV